MTAADDDYTMGELFNAHKARQQAKRRSNTEFSTELLRENGVAFTSHNAGAHLIVATRWDFWPSTGKYRERRGRPGKPLRTGRGVRNLMKLLEEESHGTANA